MKIKFTTFQIVVSLTAILLAGCSRASTPTLSASNGLSMATRLALGTLKLEGTSNAVTSSEASQLLILWQGYQSTSSSDTASQVELDALVRQIEDSMSAAQIEAIEAMHLTEQSVSETLSAHSTGNASGTPSGTANAPSTSSSGSTVGSSGIPFTGSSSMPSANSGSMPSGGPGGMPPGGDSSGVGDVLNGVTVQATQTTTQTASQTGIEQVNPTLLQALIQMLEASSRLAV